jgi:integrase
VPALRPEHDLSREGVAMKLRDLCERYLGEMKLGASNRSAMARIQKYPIAQVKADRLLPSHFIDFARMRRQAVKASTVMCDITLLRSVLSYAPIAWDMEEVSEAPLVDAMKKLRQLRLISSSAKRHRIPTREESEQIRAWVVNNYHGKIPMVDILDFQDFSSRRISETCRLQWGDLNMEKKTILVRDMKHPRHKEGNDKRVALPDEAFVIVMRQPRRTEKPNERIFPYASKTITKLHAQAADACGITDLHLHDRRRGTVSWLFGKGRSVPHVMLVTGHETPQMALTVYNGLNAEDFHKTSA